jgi:hypothetical protein
MLFSSTESISMPGCAESIILVKSFHSLRDVGLFRLAMMCWFVPSKRSACVRLLSRRSCL